MRDNILFLERFDQANFRKITAVNGSLELGQNFRRNGAFWRLGRTASRSRLRLRSVHGPLETWMQGQPRCYQGAKGVP